MHFGAVLCLNAVQMTISTEVPGQFDRDWSPYHGETEKAGQADSGFRVVERAAAGCRRSASEAGLGACSRQSGHRPRNPVGQRSFQGRDACRPAAVGSLRPAARQRFANRHPRSFQSRFRSQTGKGYSWKAAIQARAGSIAVATNHSQQIVQKLWNYCNLLRDDGLSYGDYVEQLTYLLFLKMADERTRPPYDEPSFVPADKDWASLTRLDGADLEAQYRHILEDLGREPGMLGVIFQKAQNKIQDPGQAHPPDQGPDRPRALARARRRRQGRCLRGAAREERAGHQGRRGAVLHAAPADRRDRRLRPAPTRRADLRSRRRHRPASCSRPTSTSARHAALDRDQKQHLRLKALHGKELVAGRRPPGRDEPDAARGRSAHGRRGQAADPNRRQPAEARPIRTTSS